MSGGVLMVDDQPMVREALRHLLDAQGFGVIAVPDGATALATVATANVDATLVDMDMPGCRGRALFRSADSERMLSRALWSKRT